MSHSPEPWRVDEETGAIIWGADDMGVVEDWGMEPENAARIVACVNACRGIKDPEAFIDAIWLKRRLYEDLTFPETR